MLLTPNQIAERQLSNELLEQLEFKRIIFRKSNDEIYRTAIANLEDIATSEDFTLRQAFRFRRIARTKIINHWKDEDELYVESETLARKAKPIAS